MTFAVEYKMLGMQVTTFRVSSEIVDKGSIPMWSVHMHVRAYALAHRAYARAHRAYARYMCTCTAHVHMHVHMHDVQVHMHVRAYARTTLGLSKKICK